MAISINWGTSVISIPKADMTLIQSTPTEIRQLDLNTFRSTIKGLEDDLEGMPFSKTHSHNPPVTVGGVTLARVVELLPPYTVTFEDGQYAVNLVGGNSNVADRTNVNQVSVRSANSAGLVQTDEIEYAAFQNGVTIDSTSSTTGTLYPAGTYKNPVNNLSAAKLIADYRGFTRLYFIENSATLGASDDVSNYLVEGIYHDRSVMTLTTGCTITDTQFNNLAVEGDAGSDFCVMENCSLRTITNFNGNVYRSEIGGTISLNLSAFRHWVNCMSNQNTGTPVLDFQSITQNLIISDYTGDIKIRNFTGGSLELYCNSAQVELESSCTGGTISLYGTGGLTDNSAGTTVNDSDYSAAISGQLLNIEGSNHISNMLRGIMSAVCNPLTGAVAGQSGTAVLRNMANNKTRITIDYDANGNRTSVTYNDLS